MAETAEIHSHRSVLQGIAYRMLGSRAGAGDAVEEPFRGGPRQDQAQQRPDNHGEIREPRAGLITTLPRHCIDRLRSAKAQRGSYVGMWLPEPVVQEPAVE